MERSFQHIIKVANSKEFHISELLDCIVSPLSGAGPMGESINYDADFETLKVEMGKLGNIDYALIENLCKKLLKEKSKDIRLLCFLSFVVARNSQWESLADIFEGFSKLAEQGYDGMFPDRPRAKQQAIQWLSETRYNENLADKKPAEKDYVHIARLVQSLTTLKGTLEKKFPEGSPFPTGLFSAAINWEKLCKPKPKTEAPAATATGVPEPLETPKQAQAAAKKTAFFLIEKEPQKIMGYRLMRSLRWDILEKAPPAENGKTQLAPPSADLLASLQNALKANDFKTAFDKAEVAFTAAANHVWLSLQRIAATACKGLGQPYAAVHTALLCETGLLIKRVPELLTLTFSDGTPLCDDATKDWIATEVRPLFSAAGADQTAKDQTGATEGDRIEEEKGEANALAASGNIEKALDLLQSAIRCSGSERDNFRRSIILCSLLVSAKQPDIALSILESLHEKINNYHIDKWDPDLAVEAWSTMVKVLKMAKAGKQPNVQAAMHEKLNSIVSKISQIDPKKAFSLTT
jgi:type VI secretion system protein VasJ